MWRRISYVAAMLVSVVTTVWFMASHIRRSDTRSTLRTQPLRSGDSVGMRANREIRFSRPCAKVVHRQCRWAMNTSACMQCLGSAIRSTSSTTSPCTDSDTAFTTTSSTTVSSTSFVAPPTYCEPSRVRERSRLAREFLQTFDAVEASSEQMDGPIKKKGLVALFAIHSGGSWPDHLSLFEWGIMANPHIHVYLIGPALPESSLCTELPNCVHLCTSPRTCGPHAAHNAPCARAWHKLGTRCHAKKQGYAMSDMKPLLGALYPEIVQRYEFWGWSDTDVLLGHLSTLTRNRLDHVAMVHPLASAGYTTCGAFTLLRAEYAQLFRLGAWRRMVSEPKYTVFDEWWGPFHASGYDFGSALDWLRSVRPHRVTVAPLRLYDNRDYHTPTCKWCALTSDTVVWSSTGQLRLMGSSSGGAHRNVPIDIFHFIDLKHRDHWQRVVREWMLQLQTTPASQRLAMVRRTCARWGLGPDDARHNAGGPHAATYAPCIGA